MILSAAVEEFHLAARADGLADSTIAFYGAVLRRLVKHLGDGRQLDTITAHAMRQYIVDMRDSEAYADAPNKPPQGNKVSQESVNSHVRALHRFFRWAADEWHLPNPMRSIKRPPKGRSTVKAISAENFVKMFRATKDTPMGVRDRAMLALFIDTGARLGGVLGLTVDNLDTDKRQAVVTEKGQRRRVIYFSPQVGWLLVAWLDVRPARAGVLHVFTTAAGTPLTTSGIQEIFKRLRRRARVTGPASIHGYRHGFAQILMQAGVDLNTVSRLMGHKGIQITADQYGHLEPTQLGEAQAKGSPFVFLLGTSDTGSIADENKPDNS